jgi:hypothetical protein
MEFDGKELTDGCLPQTHSKQISYNMKQNHNFIAVNIVAAVTYRGSAQ